MELLPKDIMDQLLANRHASLAAIARNEEPPAHRPVVKLFTPDAACTWLLTEIAPDGRDIAWGLADLGLGFVEYGTVSIAELRALRGGLGLPVERDLHFQPTKTIWEYLTECRAVGCISV